MVVALKITAEWQHWQLPPAPRKTNGSRDLPARTRQVIEQTRHPPIALIANFSWLIAAR